APAPAPAPVEPSRWPLSALGAPDPGPPPAPGEQRPSDLGGDVTRALAPTRMTTPQLGANGLVMGGTMVGGTLGSLYPPAAPVLRPVGAAIGGEVGNLLSKVLAWQ